ncbi:MAG: ABC transporter ATP-binding protein [Candidatus Aureabacteria bacterium]|nr:ABC transporter ATP-binding protein [Candidatus Auribacterota bacterium]
MNNILVARNIEKSYESGPKLLRVLDNISLEVPEGRILFIVGPSGAGKSTLLHIIAGIDTPDKGDVMINGLDYRKLGGRKKSRLINSDIGFIFQFFHLLSEFTAVENVMLPALIRGENRKKSREKALGLLENLGLGKRAFHKPFQLSGGEQQRVAIARALVNEPGIVFADEPTGNLDKETGGEIISVIRKLSSENSKTFVIATHDYNLVSEGDNIVKLVDGRVVK